MQNKHYFLISIMVTTYLLALLVGYWVFLDGSLIGKVISIDNPTQIKTEKNIYHPGEMIRGYVTFCKYRNIIPIISDALIDDYLKIYSPKIATSGVVGCKNNTLVDLEYIPPDTFPENYHINRTLEYKINPLRTLTIQLRTTTFKVVKQ